MKYSLRSYNDSDYDFIYQTKKNAYKDYVIANYGEWNEDIQRQFFSDFINESKQNIKIQYFKQNPAGKLYERLGFKPNGETKTHFQMTMADHIDTINNTISVKQRFRKGQRS